MPPKPDLNNSLRIENKEKSLAIPPVKAKLLEGKGATTPNSVGNYIRFFDKFRE